MFYPMPKKIEPIKILRKAVAILWYATGNMQRVVFHSTFQSLIVRNSYGLLRKIPNSSNHVRKCSDGFRTLPKISEDFSKV